MRCRYLVLLLVGMPLAGCASTSSPVRTGQATRVDYHFGGTASSSSSGLAIVNTSYGSAGAKPDGTVSRVSDKLMNVFLRDLAGSGFFDLATTGQAAVPGAFLSVRTPTRVWTLHKPRQLAALESWRTYLSGFTAVFNNGQRAFGQATTGGGRNFEAERRELERRKQEALKKLTERRK